MNHNPWGGRFSSPTAHDAFTRNAALSFDQRLADQAGRASMAWVQTLMKAGTLTANDQVVTGFCRWWLDYLPEVGNAILSLRIALVKRTESDLMFFLTSYTQSRPVQPVLMSQAKSIIPESGGNWSP